MKRLFLATCMIVSGAMNLQSMPPVTPRQPVTDTYHGTAVQDDYRWLENWDDPKVKAWSEAQNAAARAYLDRLPQAPAIRQRITGIMSAKSVSFSDLAIRGQTLFAVKREPPRQQPFLIVVSDWRQPEQTRILLDPNQLDPSFTTAIDWFVPSPDGQFVAISLSRGGSESGDVHFYDVKTGKEIHEVIPHVNTGTAGGDLVWDVDGQGVFYTRHPREGERPAEDRQFFQQIYYHRLGTPTARDRYELGKDFPRIAETEFEMHEPTGTLLARVQNGDSGEFAHYLRTKDGKWTQFSKFEDQIVQATFGPSGDLYLISQVQADRGKILCLPLNIATREALPLNLARVIVPESDATVVTSFYHAPPTLLVTQSRLYVVYQLGGPSELRVFDLQGHRLPGPEQLPLSSVGGLTRVGADDVLFSNTSYVSPMAIFHFSAPGGQTEAASKTVKTWMASPSPVDFDDIQVVREFATSRDGTKIPVNILFSKSLQRDGKNPTLLYGYGGYGINLTPSFSAVRHVLLEQGFVYAVANLRGGSEYGEPWHRQGNLTKKQNVFDDFAAAAEHLIARNYTSSQHLAMEGGSNGGLLMGATLTQHPDLMRAVVSHVGIYDMLRVELSPNGVFNIVEFGTVKDPAQFQALYAYSPFHRVRDGVKYPSVLFLTGANDPRVDPMQSRKMTARLQAATASGEPILLRTTSNAGHGGDTALSEKIEQTVDVYSFLFDRLNVTYRSRSE